ncbi:unnamed protein product [Caenorhabditis sp. 36 PRJEB53466]|nr:unnamed protein product [Caenorhabditis sp. 36 PRJEB53466]
MFNENGDQSIETIYPTGGGLPGDDEEEEIDIMNPEPDTLIPTGEDEEERFHHPEHIFMLNEDENEYEEEQDVSFDYIGGEEPQQFDGVLDNQELYNAHYTGEGYPVDKDELLFETFQKYVEPISTATRLEMYPEMKLLPILKRARKPHLPNEEQTGKCWDPPKCGRVINPADGPVQAFLASTRLYPTTDQPREEKPMEPISMFLQQDRLTTSKNSRVQMRRFFRPKPAAAVDVKKFSENTVPPRGQMTPLPDRFFQKRMSITPEQAGFRSDCVECEQCGFLFRNRSMLEGHMKKHDKLKKKEIFSISAGLRCPIKTCDARSDTLATVVRHMKMKHSIGEFTFERIIFKDFNEFKMWRNELERLTMSRFSRTSGKQNIFSKSTYYQCHHSGVVPPQHTEQDPRKRSRQSKKIGRTCTAFFHVRENEDGTVLLRGCTKHTGHGVDIRHLPLSEEIKMEIAHLLIEGCDENSIVDKMRQHSDRKNRRYYLQSYEIRNVANKIEKFKEEYKRRMAAGEPLPDLGEAINGKRHSDRTVYTSTRAKLSCHRYPVVDEQIDEEYLRDAKSPNYESAFYDEEERGSSSSGEDEAVSPFKPSRTAASSEPSTSTSTEKSKELTKAVGDEATIKKLLNMPNRAKAIRRPPAPKIGKPEPVFVKENPAAAQVTTTRNSSSRKGVPKKILIEPETNETENTFSMGVTESAEPSTSSTPASAVRYSSRLKQKREDRDASRFAEEQGIPMEESKSTSLVEDETNPEDE